jgi:hypothetical protein
LPLEVCAFVAAVALAGASACVGDATLPNLSGAPDGAVQSDARVQDGSIESTSDWGEADAGPDGTVGDVADSMPDSPSDVRASNADSAPSKVVWDPSESIDPSQGTFPAVAAGPGPDGGSWTIQIQQTYPTTQFQQEAQVGTIGGGALGPATPFTANTSWTVSPPGSGLAALSDNGSVFEVASPPSYGPLFWFIGQLDPTQSQVNWPFGDQTFDQGQEISGYRPRLGSAKLGGGVGAVGVAVFMAASGAGELGYFTISFSDAPGASPVQGSVSYWSPPAIYDLGPSQNPAVALGSGAMGGTLVEVHQDESTSLYYRLGTLSMATSTAAAIAWRTDAAPYPGAEQGAHPALAVYGSTLVEVHEGPSGDLRWMTATLTAPGSISWDGPSQSYEPAGADPAIAIDPTTGNGVELHDSRARDGTVTRRVFRVGAQ